MIVALASGMMNGPAIWVSLTSFGPGSEEEVIWEQAFRDPGHAESWANKVATAFGGRVITPRDSVYIREQHKEVED